MDYEIICSANMYHLIFKSQNRCFKNNDNDLFDYNIRYPFSTHLKLKSSEISVTNNLFRVS